MIQNDRLVYLHGSGSDSNSGKARLFTNRTSIIVDDGHRLCKTVNELDWKTILA